MNITQQQTSGIESGPNMVILGEQKTKIVAKKNGLKLCV